MKQPTSAASRIMMEMFWHQGSWAIGYLVIVFLLNLALGITGSSSNIAQDDFFSIIYRSTKGFMLVIGIISSFGFLSFYVRHGFTRRDFLKEPPWPPCCCPLPFRSSSAPSACCSQR